jgi:hypothetical protein
VVEVTVWLILVTFATPEIVNVVVPLTQFVPVPVSGSVMFVGW